MTNPKKAGITAELKNGTAFIRILDNISSSGLSSSDEIRNKLDSFIKEGAVSVEVYINCRSGDYFETQNISNELDRFGADKITVKIGAVAAGPVTILTSKFYSIAGENSQIMFQKPQIGVYGDIVEVEAKIKLLKNLTDNYITMLSNKSGKTTDQIIKALSVGDLWMNADEAIKNGLINSIDGKNENSGDKKLSALYSGNSMISYLNTHGISEYYTLKESNPVLAASMEQQFINAPKPSISSNLSLKLQILASMGGKTGWSVEDYLLKDPEAYWKMLETHPKLAAKLEALYY